MEDKWQVGDLPNGALYAHASKSHKKEKKAFLRSLITVFQTCLELGADGYHVEAK